jgi:hypothetical protein
MTNKRLVISLILVSRTLWAKLLNVSLSIFWNHSLVAITPPRGIPLHGWSSSLRLLSLPPFVYTWISIEVTHCVNSSVTWWPQILIMWISMSLPIQRCAPSCYQRQFDSSLLWSFHILVECGKFAYQNWNFLYFHRYLDVFMFVSSKYVCETLISWVDHEILDFLKDPCFYSCSLFPLVQSRNNHKARN